MRASARVRGLLANRSSRSSSSLSRATRRACSISRWRFPATCRSPSRPAARPRAATTSLRRAAPVPSRRKHWSLSKDATAAEAMATVVRSCLRQIEANADGVRVGDDPEWVHQMRVGVRRLRSALALLRRAVPPDTLQPLESELRWLASVLGRVRDLDVFALDTLPAIASASQRIDASADALAAPIDVLGNRVRSQSAQARRQARAAIDSPRFAQLVLAVGRLASAPLLGVSSRNTGRRDAATACAHVRARPPEATPSQAAPRGTVAGRTTSAKRHETRIQAKKMRYAAEFFAPLFSAKRVRAYRKSLATLQQVLGAANDAAVATTLASELGAGLAVGHAGGRLGRRAFRRSRQAAGTRLARSRAREALLDRPLTTRNEPDPILAGGYRAPAWLPGGHAQTIWPYFLRRARVPMRRETVATGDGDVWEFDWLEVTPSAPGPLVVLFHGLEGSSESHYARSLFVALAARGWRGVVPHFRGCAGGRQPQATRLSLGRSRGDRCDARCDSLASRGNRPSCTRAAYRSAAARCSTGSDAPAQTRHRSCRARRQCPRPLDLMAAGHAIDRGANRIYARHFLQTLKPKALAMASRFPGLLDAERIGRVRSMWDFDDVVTSPLHGFAGTTDYWTRASSKPWLSTDRPADAGAQRPQRSVRAGRVAAAAQ